MTPLDAFNFGMERIISASNEAVRKCEDKRLDPPAERLINCLYCDGRGYFKQTHCASRTCNFLRYCPCECRGCAYLECDACEGTGEMSEPEEWKEDEYWEAAWDRDREQRESGGAP